jgi:hypothetical protein
MSSIAKAALLSAVVFAAILAAFLFLVNRSGKRPQGPIEFARTVEPTGSEPAPR